VFTKRQRRRLLSLLASVLVVVLALLPSLPHIRAYLVPQVSAGAADRKFAPTLAFFADAFNEMIFDTRQGATLPPASWVFGGLMVAGLLAAVLRRQYAALLWIVVWAILPLVVLFTVPSRHSFAVRYLIFLLPILLLLVSRGATGLVDGLQALALRGRAKTGSATWLLLLLGCLALAGLGVRPAGDYYARRKEDWRGAAAYLRSHMQPGDLVICDSIHYRRNGDSDRPFRALTYYLGPEADQYRVVREYWVAETLGVVGEEERAVWGLISGEPGRWDPEGDQAKLIGFPYAKVVRTNDAGATALEGSIVILEAFTELLKGNARFDVHVELAELYTRQGDLDRALDHLAQARALDVSDAEMARLYVQFGQLLRDMRDDEYAVLAYQRAVILQPENAWYRRLLAAAGGFPKSYDHMVAVPLVLK
jgi:tetratricopeptide (TPR) repeat protein